MAQTSYGTITITDTTDIESIVVEYAQNQDPLNAPSGGWDITRPEWAEGYYIWQRTRTHKYGTSSSADDIGVAVCITGSQGETGRSLTSTTTQYTTAVSSATITTDNMGDYIWYNNIPAYNSSTPVYWVRVTNTYSNPSTGYLDVYSGEVADGSGSSNSSSSSSQNNLENNITTVYIIYKDEGLTSAVSMSQTALTQSSSNINTIIRLWYRSNSATAPSKPTSHITQSGNNVDNTWTTTKPIDKDGYRYYYYCDELCTGGGVYKWTDVVLDTSNLSQYEIGALTTKVKNFWWDSNGAHIASGKNGNEVTTSSALTYGYNSLMGLTGISFGYDDTKVIDLTTTSPALSFYLPPTFSNNVASQGKKVMQLSSNALTFYNPNDGTTAYATLDVSGLKLVKGGIEAGIKNTTNYIYVWSHDDATNHTLNINNSGNKSDWRIVAGNNFGVDKAGNLYASNAHISGVITVSSGSNLSAGLGDYSTTSETQSYITGLGYQTESDVNSAINTATNDMATNASISNTYATKANAVKRSQVIYYRTNNTITTWTMPSSWVGISSNYNTWTTQVPVLDSNNTYCYLYTTTQIELNDGSFAYNPTIPQLDNTTTVINGGSIITGSITANEITGNKLSAIYADLGNITAGNITKGNNSINFDNSPATLEFKNASTWSAATQGIKYDSNGLAIKGAITATSLTLGSGVQIPASTAISGLSTVATTGSYNDLSNKPTIPDLTNYIYKDGTIGSTPADGATGFKVSSSGLLTASNAVIYGSIYASKGYIGGWQIGTDGNKTLHNGSANVSPVPGSGVIVISKGVVGSTTATGVLPANKTWAITADNKFGVTTDGILYASGANINGAITASSFTINSGATVNDPDNLINNSAIQVGGRNLLLNTGTQIPWTSISLNTSNYAVKDYYKTYSPVPSIFAVDDLVTISFDWETTVTSGSFHVECGAATPYTWGTVVNAIGGRSATSNYVDLSSTKTSGKFIVTFKITSSQTEAASTLQWFRIRVDGTAWSGQSLTVTNVKAERGNKATDWTPAPEDAEQYTIDYTKAQIENIQIGGKNLLAGTQIMYAGTGTFAQKTFRASGGTLSNNTNLNIPTDNLMSVLRVTNGTSSASQCGFCQDQVPLYIKSGTPITMSFWIRASAADLTIKTQAVWYNSSTCGTNVDTSKTTTSWQYVSHTAEINTDVATTCSMGYVYVTNLPASGWFEVAGLKVEVGNKATEWSDDLPVEGTNLFGAGDCITSLDGLTQTTNKFTLTTEDGLSCAHITGALATTGYIASGFTYLPQPYQFISASCDMKLKNYTAGTTNPYIAIYFGGQTIDGTWRAPTYASITYNGKKGTYVGSGNIAGAIAEKGWVHVEYTGVWPNYAYTSSLIAAYIYARDFTGDLYVRNVKVEFGHKCTPWSPYPLNNKVTNAAKTATNYITYIDSTNGIRVYDGQSSNRNVNYAQLNSNGMQVYKGTNEVANFGSTARIGLENENNLKITSNSIGLCYSDDRLFNVAYDNDDGTIEVFFADTTLLHPLPAAGCKYTNAEADAIGVFLNNECYIDESTLKVRKTSNGSETGYTLRLSYTDSSMGNCYDVLDSDGDEIDCGNYEGYFIFAGRDYGFEQNVRMYALEERENHVHMNACDGTGSFEFIGGFCMNIDSNGTSSSTATSGDDMALFNAIYNLGWYSSVIV